MEMIKDETNHQTPTLRITQVIDKKVQSLTHCTNVLELPSIFKVHQGLRRNNPEAYTPMLISIGPYHHANLNLQPSELLKFSYLLSFLARTDEESVERYVKALQELKHKALNCYAHLSQIEINDDLLVEMMLLDGCFIVEFVRRYSEIGQNNDVYKHDPIFGTDWMKVQVCCDLMLLENQLPYFVLSELYDLNGSDDDDKEPFSNLAMLVFSDMIPKLCPGSIFLNEIEEQEINHLLHLVHILCRPVSSELKSLEGFNSGSEVMDQMHCVKELEEAGIKFKKCGKVYAGIDSLDADSIDDKVSLFDIKFNEGLMEIPSLKVEDSTETFFRNLIAYEQHSSEIRPKYFTDYAVFMDQLINTDQDVNVLRRNGIIVNLLGDDGEVATLFNKLGDGVIISSNFYYLGICKQVNQHCGKIWNVVMATLRHDYFNTPWVTVSTIAAVLLLLLTIIQTIASVIPLLS
ncbi:hypothetical protein BUALT_Bualt15G0130400 [Buddleja alternifolia]|uniref:Uncharacterized protein n=1 Tax=Buddleja alternifolia TaxID=168488 RepID=A0AAV6WGQ3_9LAMI|nr:hypothetical protein BUALT_Bualt15G0130400 [Buddleja alternifolia]